MNYRAEYLKYKKKYLNIKQSQIQQQFGGGKPINFKNKNGEIISSETNDKDTTTIFDIVKKRYPLTKYVYIYETVNSYDVYIEKPEYKLNICNKDKCFKLTTLTS